MPLRIAILGASGAVGNTLAAHLLRERLLEPEDRLLLVGHGTDSVERRLYAVKIDLLDAFDERRVHVEIVPDITDFEADIVVVASSAVSAEAATRRDPGIAGTAYPFPLGQPLKSASTPSCSRVHRGRQ